MNDSRGLRFLYDTGPGRLCLRLLTRRWVSRLAGAFLSTGLSRAMVPGFVRRNGIDMSDYEPRQYSSFNDFFTRQLKSDARPIDRADDALVAPCDSRVSVYDIDPDCRLRIKGQQYTVAQLLGFGEEPGADEPPAGPDDPLAALDALAQGFNGGTALVFRLCVDDYHRYCYFDDCSQGDRVFIPGRLHTVRPGALARVQVFARNCREYCVLDTAHFGRAVQVEVGAMMVGRICNLHGPGDYRRGQEKGMFQFGGSTVVLLLEKGRARLNPALEAVRGRDTEVRVLLGQRIGEKA